MVRLDRRGGTWKLLGSVVWAHRQVTDLLDLLTYLLTYFLLTQLETTRDNNNCFKGVTTWWNVVKMPFPLVPQLVHKIDADPVSLKSKRSGM